MTSSLKIFVALALKLRNVVDYAYKFSSPHYPPHLTNTSVCDVKVVYPLENVHVRIAKTEDFFIF